MIQSGNSNNATQSTVGSQPSLSPVSLTGNARSVIFDSVINGASKVNKYMTMPAGVAAAAGNNVSAFVLGRTYSSERSASFLQLTNATFPQAFVSAYSATPPLYLKFGYGAGYTAPSVAMSETYTFAGYISSSSAISVYLNEGVSSYSPSSNQAMAGGYIGASAADLAANSTGYVEMVAVVIYPRGLATTTDVPTLKAALSNSFGTQPQIRNVVVVDGDSITEGFGSTLLQNRTRQMIQFLTKPANVINKGFYGVTLANRVTNYPSDISQLFTPTSTNNILEIFAGTNDNDGTDPTGATLYANTVAYVNEAHATGFKVLVATMLPRNWTTAQITEQLAFNSLVRANTANADAIIDYAADPTMGLQTNTTNTNYYVDGTHPTTLGYSYLAQIEATAFNSIMQ